MKNIKLNLLLLIVIACVIGNVQTIKGATNYMLKLGSYDRTCVLYTLPGNGQKITYTNPAYGRDAAFLGEKNGYYKIMISGVTGWISKTGPCMGPNSGKIAVNNIDNFSYSTDNKALSGLDVSRYQVVNNKMYFVSTYTGYSYDYMTGTTGYTDVPTGLVNNKIYYSYDGVYFYLNYNTMITDYLNNNRNNAANKNNPYYDYYMYLPLRTNTKIGATFFDKKLLAINGVYDDDFKQTLTFNRSCANLGNYTHTYNGKYSALYNKANNFITAQSNNKMNAGLLYGIALNESANGTSNLSRHYNNPFGWGAVDSCPNSATIYSNMQSAITKYFENMSNSYGNVYNLGGVGTNLGNKQSGANVNYASDPYWGYKNAYNYRKLDELSGNKDKNTYYIGILNSGKNAVDGKLSDEEIYAYQSASTTSKKLYYYERNNSSVIIKGESGAFYLIQNDTGNNKADAYILKSYVKALIGKKSYGTTPSTPTTPVVNLTKVMVDKIGNNYYLWGDNALGQLGNGNTKDVEQKNRINITSLLPKNETVKNIIVYYHSNIVILTNSGNVYASGPNKYYLRSYTSVNNKFNKVNPFNDKISEIKVLDNRLRMQRANDHNEYYYVGHNSFNLNNTKYNWNTNYPVRVLFNKYDSAIRAYRYDYSKNVLMDTYVYKNGVITNTYFRTYNDKKQIITMKQTNFTKTMKSYAKVTSYVNNIVTYKLEYYYNNIGYLKTTTKKKAYRYETNYSKGKATSSYLRYYDSKGNLLKKSKVNTRK
ncbi:MAG: glucosaminidase domain-containing protein [Bacilli bacterium]|jgi:hypothetical protein|nr:glucosaminidase domain-containing protein [Bacilli bacterium]